MTPHEILWVLRGVENGTILAAEPNARWTRAAWAGTVYDYGAIAGFETVFSTLSGPQSAGEL